MTIANNIATALELEGYTAKIWEANDITRVYVTRMLSRGRRQNMGYLECRDGEWHNGGMVRMASGIATIAGI